MSQISATESAGFIFPDLVLEQTDQRAYWSDSAVRAMAIEAILRRRYVHRRGKPYGARRVRL